MTLFDILDNALAQLQADGYDLNKGTYLIPSQNKTPATPKKQPSNVLYSCNGVNGYFVPEISRVHYNGNTTIVFFTDGSKCVIECSLADVYDRQTAIAYAICKRLFGKVGAYSDQEHKRWDPYLVDGAGFGQKMKKIVDLGFDQVLAEKQLAEQKRQAKAFHEAKQKAEQEAAFERRAKRLAEEILLKRRATDIANDIEDSLNIPKKATDKPKQMLNENKSANKPYVRPNKPFKDFTIDEKHEYWREQNRKRKLNK